MEEASTIKYHRDQLHNRFDALTGIYNKEYFVQKTEDMLNQNPGRKYVILYINIYRFNLINNMLGINAGDSLLIKIAEHLQNYMPTECTYCRTHSDNFVICFPTDKYNIEKFLDEFIDIYEFNGIEYRLNICAGAYEYNGHGTLAVEQMLERALIALKSIKGTYKNFGVYNDDLLHQLLVENEILGEMKNALSGGQFIIYLQPQYNHDKKSLVGAEALVRWNHPEKGIIPPNHFIPLFEQNGFIYVLDTYILECACKLIHKWRTEHNINFTLSVNVSRIDIYDPRFSSTLVNLVKKYDIPPALLHLEITESAYMDDPNELITAVQKLRDLGFFVAMDDFGSGYSSLNMLKDIAVDILKIDMRFLYSENHNERNIGNILKNVVNMASWLSVPVIAEGVESIEQADFLGSIGCDFVQGYLYSRPIPVEEFEKLLFNLPTEAIAINDSSIVQSPRMYFVHNQSDLQAIIDAMPVGTCIYDPDLNMIPVLYNTCFCEMLGYTPSQFKNEVKNLISLINEDDRQKFYDGLHDINILNDHLTGTVKVTKHDGAEEVFNYKTSILSENVFGKITHLLILEK